MRARSLPVGTFQVALFISSSVAVAFAAFNALAADPALDYGCDRTLHVGVMEFGAMYHQGEGVDADIIAELAQRSGCKLELRQILRAELWPAMETGELDMATSSIATPEREKVARFITYFGIKNMLIMPAGQGETTFSLAAFAARPDSRIGLVKGFRYGNYYDYHLKVMLGENRMVEVPTQADLFMALREKRVDAILAPAIHYFFYLTEEEQQDRYVLINASPAPATASGLALSRAHFTAAQTNNWMRLIEVMHLDRTLHRLVTRRISKAAAANVTEY